MTSNLGDETSFLDFNIPEGTFGSPENPNPGAGG